ncbi:MAG: hypothetical protein HYY13_05515 [Nitrospirae bacterium]|nr:hypothetical protein [Nitrospirota bacterium]
MTQREIELSREISSHVPWKPQVGDTYVCRGRPQTVWRLPAPCHEGDFLVWGLHEAKTWLRENGVQDIELTRSPSGWTGRILLSATGEDLRAAGATDAEAALQLVLMLVTARA